MTLGKNKGVLEFLATTCHQTQVSKEIFVPSKIFVRFFRVVTWIGFPVFYFIFCAVYLTVESFWCSFLLEASYSVSLFSCQGSRSVLGAAGNIDRYVVLHLEGHGALGDIAESGSG